jgi:hypothetical protein
MHEDSSEPISQYSRDVGHVVAGVCHEIALRLGFAILSANVDERLRPTQVYGRLRLTQV